MEEELKELFKELLIATSEKMDRTSYENEPNYIAGFFGKLHNETLTSSTGQFLKIVTSTSNDRGPGTAEKKTGIDFGMVFKWVDSEKEIVFEKAVIAQAKNHLFNLSKKDKQDLQSQCEKMSKITDSYVAMDCPYDESVPLICRSSKQPPFWDEKSKISLAEYLCNIVLECLEGDTSKEVVDIAKRSDRGLVLKTNAPRPKIKNENKPKPKKLKPKRPKRK
ncbi:TPA: hypothetical protein ACGFXY_003453 [Vibrio cholerae]|uniref:hypothetical protein n=1 Tax=Vibrio cholerae TaxID=666 RepID=UPI0028D9A5A7|nr:hypothetical protein [Vibrio cholerae]